MVGYQLLLLHLLVHHTGLNLSVLELISEFGGEKVLHGLIQLLLILGHHQSDPSLAFWDVLDLKGFKKLAAEGPMKFKSASKKNFTLQGQAAKSAPQFSIFRLELLET